ncbi:GntR family transcriptional regulator [Thermosyntropha sp.]|uniref:GntR family transcriptional regulator n=1 Tax=Thermosyntropha sp. TaxID=2740820 RepID=UPI0025E085F3|nr:GntR family transcriptional regulator [Thermosyntropha sp.]MBO8159794.1 GntR family transcriptional regulator [Thermosyntropha sp.]
MDFDSGRPIYMQIIEDFKKRMIRGELTKGDKIPSQREYAQSAHINPNTVQRAYREMEYMGLVETIRGQGTFVSVSDETIVKLKKEMVERLVVDFISDMKELGFTFKEIEEMIKEMLEKGGFFNDRV